jgi:putative ABC transport system ATP-binding protein
MPLVEVRRVSKEYASAAGPVRALTSVSLTVASGTICAIVGPSGSGKSTLLGLMGGLDRPTGGDVWVCGADLGRMAPRPRAGFRLTHIGLIFQANNLIPVLTAAENIGLPLSLSRLSLRERRWRVDEFIDELGLRGVAGRRPAELSGGQQQRVGIARALVMNPELVLADEPTAHLDVDTAFEVMNLLQSMNAQRGTTLVFSTHDPAIEAIAANRFVLRDGCILEERTTEPQITWQSYSSLPSGISAAILDGR